MRPRRTSASAAAICARVPPTWTVPASPTRGSAHGIGPSRTRSTFAAPGPWPRRRSPAPTRLGRKSPRMLAAASAVVSSRIAEAAGRSASERTRVPVRTSPPWAARSARSASVIAWEPPAGIGHPSAWASAASSRPVPAVVGEGWRPIAWVATPVSRARAASVRQGRFQASVPSSTAPAANPAAARRSASPRRRGRERLSPRASSMTASGAAARGSKRRRQVGPSVPRSATVRSRSRWASAAGASSSGCA